MDEDVRAIIDDARRAVGTPGEGAWFDRIDAARERVDAALLAALEDGDTATAVRLAAALWPYWMRRAPDGQQWLARMREVSEQAPPSAALAEVFYARGLWAFRHGDTDASAELNERALATAKEAGSTRGQAMAHVGLSRVAFRARKYEEGLQHATSAERCAARADDLLLQTSALHMQAEIMRAQGAYAASVPLYEQLLSIAEEAGDHHALAMENYNLGSVLLQSGDLPAAANHLHESLRLTDDRDAAQLPYTLLGLSGLAVRRGDTDLAGRLLGAVLAHFERTGEVLDPAEEVEARSHLEAGRASGARFDAAVEEGRSMTLEQARELLR